jgi:hypothetical protein
VHRGIKQQSDEQGCDAQKLTYRPNRFHAAMLSHPVAAVATKEKALRRGLFATVWILPVRDSRSGKLECRTFSLG